MFSVKDSVPQGLPSRAVYKFSCAGCNASYIGETTHHLCVRVREHLLSDKCSHAYRHLQSSRACHDSCDTECFTILDPATSKLQIKIKEALHIKWENPILNQQLRHLDLSFCSFCHFFFVMCELFVFAYLIFHIQIVTQVLTWNFVTYLNIKFKCTTVESSFATEDDMKMSKHVF